MELGAIENKNKIKSRDVRCELRLNVGELGDDGEPTKRCLLALLDVADEKIRKFNRNNSTNFALYSVSKVELIAECLPIIRFIYYATSEEMVDED